jgi:hypothetical protein
MSYSLTIGNAYLAGPYRDSIKYYIDVQEFSHPEAPAFGEPSDHRSSRFPGYTTWSDFCNEVGLTELFFDEESGLLANHPGTCALTESHLAEITGALERRRASNGGKAPGFKEQTQDGHFKDVGKDPQLARLVWLEYWVRWALQNCERPAFGNG